MIDHFARAVIAKIDQRIDELAKDLADGCAKDFYEYRRVTGMVAGLNHARQELIDLYERYEEEDFD